MAIRPSFQQPYTSRLAPPTSSGTTNPTPITPPTGHTLGAGFAGELVGVGCALITHPVARAACELLARRIPGGGTTVPGGGITVPGGGGVASCPEGSFPNPVNPSQCLDLQPGGPVSGGGMVLSTGEAVMGRFGAALVPQQVSQTVARCPRGAVLGLDGLCYNRATLRTSERKWVPARKPLLTGGDLNAIARAARAAGKMKTQQARLQKLGLLAKPKARQSRPPAHHHHEDHHHG